MNPSARRERFREIMSANQCVCPASVHDPLSARIAEEIGFEAGVLAGSVASLAVLGAPDLILLTLTEFAEQAGRIGRAGNLPLLVDADHGYGNALNVMRTVEELERAGVAALMIEDTLLPRSFDQGERPSLIPVDEGVGKMRAALRARSDASLVVVGRTSAAAITGRDNAIARCRRYQEAGVDAVFVTDFKSYEEIEALSAALTIPIMLGTLTPQIADRQRLASIGVRIALQGHAPYLAAVEATRHALQALRDGIAPCDITGVASANFIRTITKDDDYRRLVADFLGFDDR